MADAPPQRDPHAALLGVIAHDLLAPLTAIKWQTELLLRPGIAATQRVTYLEQVAESAQLGIVLTKHVHVASLVLAGAYEGTERQVALAESVGKTAATLRAQYERHGVALAVSCAPDGRLFTGDPDLASLLTWALAKFLLASVPYRAAVEVTGTPATAPDGYQLVFRAVGVPDVGVCVERFHASGEAGVYDQAKLFATLSHTVASLVRATVVARAEGEHLVLAAVFGYH